MATFFITGANRGIGLGLTRKALAAGHRVIAAARNPDGARDLWELEGDYGDRLRVVALEVDDEETVAALGKALEGETIDFLVNNAGILEEGSVPFEKLSFETVERAFRVNTLGPMRVIRALLPALRRAKNPVVASMSSMMGSIADNAGGGSYSYRMSKAALNMFNKNLSIEYPNLTCVVLHPGWVKTDMGGAGAPLSVDDSTEGLYEVVVGLSRADTGRFLDFRGKELPW